MNIESFLNEKELKIFQKYKNKLPFKVVEFADEIGIDVFEDELDDNISGKILFNKNTERFEIYVNSLHSINRKVFTVAHELGHYFRHKDFVKENGNEDILYNKFQENRQSESEEEKNREIQANDFAAELLMPEISVRDKWDYFNKSISKMANYFNVSEIAMAFRVKNIIGSNYLNEYLI